MKSILASLHFNNKYIDLVSFSCIILSMKHNTAPSNCIPKKKKLSDEHSVPLVSCNRRYDDAIVALFSFAFFFFHSFLSPFFRSWMKNREKIGYFPILYFYSHFQFTHRIVWKKYAVVNFGAISPMSFIVQSQCARAFVCNFLTKTEMWNGEKGFGRHFVALSLALPPAFRLCCRLRWVWAQTKFYFVRQRTKRTKCHALPLWLVHNFFFVHLLISTLHRVYIFDARFATKQSYDPISWCEFFIRFAVDVICMQRNEMTFFTWF